MATVLTLIGWNALIVAGLAIGVAGACRLRFLQLRPAIRHLLWLLVVLKLITPPLISVPLLPALTWDTAQAAGPALDVAELPANVNSFDLDVVPLTASAWDIPALSMTWPYLVGAASVLGSAIFLSMAIRQVRRLNRILRQVGATDARLQRICKICADRLGLAQAPEVYLVDGQLAPLLWVRYSGPVIVLPRSLSSVLSDEELMCILSHEIAHYLRRDHWTNLFAFLAAALVWWNPVVWWARSELRAAQELCCDALAIGSSSDRRCYAMTLFRVLEFIDAEGPVLPELANGFGGKSSVKRRFEMIASENLSHRMGWWAYLMAAALVAILPVLPVTAFEHSATGSGPWETAESFVEAARAGRMEEAAALAHQTAAGKAWATEIAHVEGLEGPIIASVRSSRTSPRLAVAVSHRLWIRGPEGNLELGKLTLTLIQEAGQWRVHEVSFVNATTQQGNARESAKGPTQPSGRKQASRSEWRAELLELPPSCAGGSVLQSKKCFQCHDDSKGQRSRLGELEPSYHCLRESVWGMA
ncbi:MAG: M56 family metallopeptidase, partial [Verrucomicrobiales bacterium]|nr:M56 family metallopeptidase [Verrucomicrobiales bacterium]